MRATWSAVTPYLAQQVPPALVARLPPMEEIARLPGSGTYQSPFSATAAARSPLMTPAARSRGARIRRSAESRSSARGSARCTRRWRSPARQSGAGSAGDHRDAAAVRDLQVATTSSVLRARTHRERVPVGREQRLVRRYASI